MKEKNYFKGVKKIKRQDLTGVEIITVSGRAPDMAQWILDNQTETGWINIDIKQKSSPGLTGTHVAYLNPNQSHETK